MLQRGLRVLRCPRTLSMIDGVVQKQGFLTSTVVSQQPNKATAKHVLETSDFAHPKGLRYSRPANENVEASRCSILEELAQVPVPTYALGDEETTFKGLDPDFPCLAKQQQSGPEPEYEKVVSGYKVYHHASPFYLMHSKGVLPRLDVAYETWGELNEKKDNAILLCTGLSASSHAKSHAENEKPGWWEKFIGSGCALDTDKYFIVCSNNLAGCYGTTGPSSVNPLTDQPYGTTFPIVTVEDQVRAQFSVLDHLGISKLYACVGSSLGGMQSLAAAVMYPERVGKTVSISACASTHPTAIVLRYLQRKAIMMDPQWHRGHYYQHNTFPRFGMKLAREIGTITYRSGPEWDERFGRRRIDENDEPSLCPHFMIENYLEYQGEQFCTRYDPNSLIYISKAMDLFDLSETFGGMHNALARVISPIMVIGVKTDMLFPVWQQRELAQHLQEAGNDAVTYFELNSIYGHDTFLLDLNGVGSGVKGFLDTHLPETGRTRQRKDR